MAPKKQILTRAAVSSSLRQTRRSTDRANGIGSPPVIPLPKKSPAKKTAKAKGKRPREAEEKSDDAPSSGKSAAKKKARKSPVTKKGKQTKSTPEVEVKSEKEAESSTQKSGGDVDKEVSVDLVPKKSPAKKKGGKAKSTSEVEEKSNDETEGDSKKIVIEHCKQCNSFKTRANQVKSSLESGVSGITVLINPDKPRKGCFEIREEGGETFISLLDMKRPFTAMKELNMDTVIEEIIAKIK